MENTSASTRIRLAVSRRAFPALTPLMCRLIWPPLLSSIVMEAMTLDVVDIGVTVAGVAEICVS